MSDKRIKYLVTFQMLVGIVLLISIFILDHGKSNWVSGPVLLVIGLITVMVLFILTMVVWTSSSKHILLVSTVLSTFILLFLLTLFVQFIQNTT